MRFCLLPLYLFLTGATKATQVVVLNEDMYIKMCVVLNENHFECICISTKSNSISGRGSLLGTTQSVTCCGSQQRHVH